MSAVVRFFPAGDRALLVELGDGIDPETNRRVRALLQLLDRIPVAGVRDVIPSYRSLLVDYDPAVVDRGELEARLRERLGRLDQASLPPPRMVEIPTLYGGDMGPDLEFVARHHGLTPEEVVKLHAGGEYLVYLVGFSPGFPFLGGLPRELATPRLDNPRLRVPAGSVAIGGEQTGVYPFPTAGGWRLIGRTPLQLFDPGRSEPFLLAPGDLVRFVPISREEFHRLQQDAVSKGLGSGD
ncbi:MAG: 5-oxoprolinase subunit PxpB [Firmicutes bacterium]|nr:5-oxoprolinase subunit PxpB [Bacillota bacterium]MCL5038253.1 5-oxoprolinase subunit PxpB [Bacillota bacterium]